MRTREEIEKELQGEQGFSGNAVNQAVIIELLLDIRDLLKEGKE